MSNENKDAVGNTDTIQNGDALPSLGAAFCSEFPDRSGFFWWRERPENEWRVVRVVDFGASSSGVKLLVAYDVHEQSFGGRTLKTWAKHPEIHPCGDWVAINPPNVERSREASPTCDKQKHL